MSKGCLTGRRVLVTGGGTGIGKSCARAFADEGARVTIAGPEMAVLEQAIAELVAEDEARQLVPVPCDVTVESQLEEAVAVAADGGALHIAMANAGTGFPGSLLHLEHDHWMIPLGINVIGTAHTIKHAALNMKQHGGGSIITVSSVASQRQTKFMAAYGVSKAAIDELTRSAAQELGQFSIRVNAIRPGFIQTDSLMGSVNEDNLAQARRETALPRLGQADDVARAAIYLGSDQSEWVTGQTLGVCGGYCLVPPSMDVEHLARMIFPEQMARDFGEPQ